MNTSTQSKNPWEDCDRIRKSYYTPLEVAIRWCGLADRESSIKQAESEPWHVSAGELLQFPCLAVHSSAVEDAFELGQLPCGRDGRAVTDNVARSRRTVAHNDLKEWMRSEYPADARKQHMGWLLDEVERSVHPAISTEAYAMLKAEADALRQKLEAATNRATAAESALKQAQNNEVSADDPRSRKSMLRIIRSLDVMAKLPDRGAATSIEAQLQRLGFTSPREAAIRETIENARALELDERPQ